jgi:hypothetical protein
VNPYSSSVSRICSCNGPGEAAAFERLDSDMAKLFESQGGREGLRSFVERRAARFIGR